MDLVRKYVLWLAALTTLAASHAHAQREKTGLREQVEVACNVLASLGFDFSDSNPPGGGKPAVPSIEGACADAKPPAEPVSAEVVAGEPTSLQLGDVRVLVPAGALPAGVEVTLSDAIDPLLSPPSESSLGGRRSEASVSLKVSEPVVASLPIRIEIPVSADEPLSTHVMYRSAGTPVLGGFDPGEWSLGFGSINEDRSAVVYNFLGALESVQLLGFDFEATNSLSAMQWPRSDDGREAMLRATSSSAEKADTALGDSLSPREIDIDGLDWLLVCLATCDVLPSGAGQAIANDFFQASEIFAAAGARTARVEATTLAQAEYFRNRFSASGGANRAWVSNGFFRSTNPQQLVLVSHVDRAKLAGNSTNNGKYNPASGRISVSRTLLSGDLQEASRTVMHELSHALTYDAAFLETPWVAESLASALEASAPIYLGATGLEFEWLPNVPRTWEVPLNAVGEPALIEYRSSPFWFSVGNPLDYFADLKRAAGGSTFGSGKAVSYAELDDLLKASGLNDLETAYMDLIKDRSVRPEYTAAACNGNLTSVSPTDSWSYAATPNPDGTPMTAMCSALEFLIPEGECSDPKVSLRLNDQGSGVNRMIIDGTVYGPEEEAVLEAANADDAADSGAGDALNVFFVTLDVNEDSQAAASLAGIESKYQCGDELVCALADDTAIGSQGRTGGLILRCVDTAGRVKRVESVQYSRGRLALSGLQTNSELIPLGNDPQARFEQDRLRVTFEFGLFGTGVNLNLNEGVVVTVDGPVVRRETVTIGSGNVEVNDRSYVIDGSVVDAAGFIMDAGRRIVSENRFVDKDAGEFGLLESTLIQCFEGSRNRSRVDRAVYDGNGNVVSISEAEGDGCPIPGDQLQRMLKAVNINDLWLLPCVNGTSTESWCTLND